MSGPAAGRRRGAALIVVLVFAALLASLAAAATRSAVSGARAASAFLDLMRADELGLSVGNLVAYKLSIAGQDGWRGGSFAVDLEDANVTVDYVSESARVDVNDSPVALIAALLEAAGASPQQVRDAVDRINAARRARTPDLVEAGTAPPRLQHTNEATRAWGLSAALARRVLPYLTVANPAGIIDSVLAERPVVAALMGGDEIRVDDYLARRLQGFVNTNSALDLLPTTMRGFIGFNDVRTVRAIARVTVAQRFTRRYEVIVEPPSSSHKSVTILSWRPLFRD